MAQKVTLSFASLFALCVAMPALAQQTDQAGAGDGDAIAAALDDVRLAVDPGQRRRFRMPELHDDQDVVANLGLRLRIAVDAIAGAILGRMAIVAKGDGNPQRLFGLFSMRRYGESPAV